MNPLTRTGAVALGLAALATVARPQTTWVVDAAGSGDFTDLQLALDTVAAGDVLLLLKGSYTASVVSQSVTILGDPDHPRPLVPSLDVFGAERLTLVHIETRAMRLTDVPGTVLIDDCLIQYGGWPTPAGTPSSLYSACVVSGCADVRLSRSELRADTAFAQGESGMAVVAGSRVQLGQCTIEGGPTFADNSLGGLSGYGGAGLVVGNSSVWLTETTLRGGDGEDFSDPFQGQFEAGRGGSALHVSEAFVDARGCGATRFEGGLQNFGVSGPSDGDAIECGGFFVGPSVVELSGIETVGAVDLMCGELIQPMRPALTVDGEDGPGLLRSVKLFGDPGTLAVLVASLGTQAAALPDLQNGLLWVALDQALPWLSGQLLGFDEPLTFRWTQPRSPALAGFEFHTQGVQVAPNGTLEATHSGSFVLSF